MYVSVFLAGCVWISLVAAFYAVTLCHAPQSLRAHGLAQGPTEGRGGATQGLPATRWKSQDLLPRAN